MIRQSNSDETFLTDGKKASESIFKIDFDDDEDGQADTKKEKKPIETEPIEDPNMIEEERYLPKNSMKQPQYRTEEFGYVAPQRELGRDCYHRLPQANSRFLL